MGVGVAASLLLNRPGSSNPAGCILALQSVQGGSNVTATTRGGNINVQEFKVF